MPRNRLSIMQPYFFPYLGYFQLIWAADRFIFYDDVNYITGGWINRNRILINNTAKYLTIPCSKASQNKLIQEINHSLDDKNREKLVRKIKHAYKNAPHFKEVYPLIRDVIYANSMTISEVAITSIRVTMDYLGIATPLKKSSASYHNQHLHGTARILDICKKEDASTYTNAIGGREIYSRQDFSDEGIDLKFLKPIIPTYEQFSGPFLSGLSIIDVLMFNTIPQVHEMLSEYTLE